MKDGLLSFGRGQIAETLAQAPVAKVEEDFDPRAFPNFRVWLDSSYYGTLWQEPAMVNRSWGKSSPVGRWNDRSGNGTNAQQPFSFQQPAFDDGAQSGRFGVAFTPSQFLPLGPFDGNAPFTLFIVVRVANAATFKYLISGDFNGVALYFNPPGNYILAKNGIGNLLVSTNPAPLGATCVIVVTYDGSNTTFRLNGAANGSGSSALVPTGNVIQLGSLDFGTNNFEGTVYEVRWYGAVLTAAQIAAHEKDLNRKWNVF